MVLLPLGCLLWQHVLVFRVNAGVFKITNEEEEEGQQVYRFVFPGQGSSLASFGEGRCKWKSTAI